MLISFTVMSSGAGALNTSLQPVKATDDDDAEINQIRLGQLPTD